jgi:hypothetical protein
VLPKAAASKTETVEAHRPIPKMLTEEPALKKDRRLKLELNVAKSNTLVDDPNRAAPKTERPLPNLANDLTDKQLPMVT